MTSEWKYLLFSSTAGTNMSRQLLARTVDEAERARSPTSRKGVGECLYYIIWQKKYVYRDEIISFKI